MPDDAASPRHRKSRGDAPVDGDQARSGKSQAGRRSARSRAEEVAARSRSRKGRLTARPTEAAPADGALTDEQPKGSDELFEAEDPNAPPPDDADFDEAAARRSSLPPSVERWRQRSGAGQVLTAVALGLQQVFERERDNRPAIVQEAPGDPYSDDDPVVVDFEPEDVDNTTVKVRPWLFDSAGRPVDPDFDAETGTGVKPENVAADDVGEVPDLDADLDPDLDPDRHETERDDDGSDDRRPTPDRTEQQHRGSR